MAVNSCSMILIKVPRMTWDRSSRPTTQSIWTDHAKEYRCNKAPTKCPASIGTVFAVQRDTWSTQSPLWTPPVIPACATVCSICFALISMRFVPRRVSTNCSIRAAVSCTRSFRSQVLALSNYHLKSFHLITLLIMLPVWRSYPKAA